MNAIPLAIVGCGGMGHRHLFGLAELHRAGLSRFALVGACDPVRANAESLADQAAAFFGTRPTVVASLDELAALDIAAVDITTTPRVHHTLAEDALGRGWHAMVEKPLGLTVRSSNRIWRAARESGRVLSVAENYRRDPINRLARALLDAGAVGVPRLLLHHVIDGGDQMFISVWRHQKDQSGVLLDVGVHYADMMEYLLGPIDSVYAQTRLHEPVRHNAAATGGAALANPSGVYGRWQREMPATFDATAEDAVYATLLFASGAVGQYVEDHAGHGQNQWLRQIYGSAGSLLLPNDRTGGEIVLQRKSGELRGTQLLDLVPGFRLDEATARLFGGERLGSYAFPFEETDRKLLAVEYADFAGAILGEHPPEVDAEQGTRSVAVSYALLESGVSGRPVTIAEALAEQVTSYQQSIDEGLGLM
jgi:predicted dehydrogenase